MIYSLAKAEGDILERRWDCMFRNTYSLNERLKFFPFNKYKKVVLISFEWPEPQDKIIIDSLGKRHYIADTIPDLDTKEQLQKFYKSITKEEKSLNSTQLNQLTNVLYNIGVKSNKSYHGIRNVETSYSCYDPRNAILFLDEKDILAEYIEFCFECHGRRVSSEKIKLNTFCNQKYDILKKFFKSAGIKYVEQNRNYDKTNEIQ